MLQFHQNIPGCKNGSRLVVEAGSTLPLAYADRFEVYRPGQLALAAGDRLRITTNGRTKDGKHKLANGDLLTLRGFTKQGDLVVDHDWVIAKEFGHLTHGYCVTSHACAGADGGQNLCGDFERIIAGDEPANPLCGRNQGQRTVPRRDRQQGGTGESRRAA